MSKRCLGNNTNIHYLKSVCVKMLVTNMVLSEAKKGLYKPNIVAGKHNTIIPMHGF